MKIAIVGSRSIDKAEDVFPIIFRFIEDRCSGRSVTLISGGAKGVDSLVKKYSEQRGLDFVEFLPYHLIDNGVEFSSRYFFARNRQLVSNADEVLAIWDGVSTGTQHAIRYAQKIGVPVMVIKVQKA